MRLFPLADVGVGAAVMSERRALAQIVETADVLNVDGAVFLLVPALPELIDTLAAFGAEDEDREPEDEADDDMEDDRPGSPWATL